MTLFPYSDDLVLGSPPQGVRVNDDDPLRLPQFTVLTQDHFNTEVDQ